VKKSEHSQKPLEIHSRISEKVLIRKISHHKLLNWIFRGRVWRLWTRNIFCSFQVPHADVLTRSLSTVSSHLVPLEKKKYSIWHWRLSIAHHDFYHPTFAVRWVNHYKFAWIRREWRNLFKHSHKIIFHIENHQWAHSEG
jgi:hypothetical protein